MPSVPHRHGRGSVPEQLLKSGQVESGLDRMNREGVPEIMDTYFMQFGRGACAINTFCARPYVNG